MSLDVQENTIVIREYSITGLTLEDLRKLVQLLQRYQYMTVGPLAATFYDDLRSRIQAKFPV